MNARARAYDAEHTALWARGEARRAAARVAQAAANGESVARVRFHERRWRDADARAHAALATLRTALDAWEACAPRVLVRRRSAAPYRRHRGHHSRGYRRHLTRRTSARRTSDDDGSGSSSSGSVS